MRIVLLIATSALVAACSQGTTGDAEQRIPTLSAPPPTATTTPTTTTAAPTGPPASGAAIADVVRFVEAGTPADPDGFRTAIRDGQTTELGEDIAFVTPSVTANCMTDARYDGELACLVELSDPPPRPTPGEGEWKGGWVDFAGPTLAVGSAHADPGRFSAGTGAELAYGQTLAFGDYRCRADRDGLYCVNYAHRTAAKLGAAGIEAFGCLQREQPPADVGVQYSC